MAFSVCGAAPIAGGRTPDEVRVALREADPADRRWRAWPRPAAAASRPARRRRASRRWRRCRGPRSAPALRASAGARRASASAAGSGAARPITARAMAARSDRRRPRRSSRPSGSRRTPGPWAAATRGGSPARCAPGTSCGARRLVAPLHVGLRADGRVAVGEVGLDRDLRPDLLAGGDHQRRLVGLGVEDRRRPRCRRPARCGG